MSREKLKSLYFHYHIVYGHQPWPGGDLPEEAPTRKSLWIFNHVILHDLVAN